MLTIFSVPKGFVGRNRLIQRNAIASWKLLRPACELILYGDDEGVAEHAAEYGAIHVPIVEKNEYGTPLLRTVFHHSQDIASNDLLMYVNSDILLSRNLLEILPTLRLKQFMLCGRRWDVDVEQEYQFTASNDFEEKLKCLKNQGQLHGPAGIDYFVFPRHQVNMPPFAIGRPGWDSWLLYDMKQRGIPIIDATDRVTVLHQNHDYSHSKYGEKKRVSGPELVENIHLAGGLSNMLTLRDADFVLAKDGLEKPPVGRRIMSSLSRYRLWRDFVALRRRCREKLESDQA